VKKKKAERRGNRIIREAYRRKVEEKMGENISE
jgi:hypothetical protein